MIISESSENSRRDTQWKDACAAEMVSASNRFATFPFAFRQIFNGAVKVNVTGDGSPIISSLEAKFHPRAH